MKNQRNPFLALFSASVILIATLSAGCSRQEATNDHRAIGEDLKKVVLAKKTVRVAYTNYPPGVSVDPNTKKVSGVMVDVFEKAAENLGLKVEYFGEVGWGEMVEGLERGRYDAVLEVWPNSSRAKQVDFSEPLFFSGIGVYARADDSRFDGSLAAINDANVKIAMIDGEMSQIIAKTDYPTASQVSLPQLSQVSQLLLEVASGKADVTFVEAYQADEFLAKNPGRLKNIAANHPIRVFGNTIMIPAGQSSFKAMLNTALGELLQSGFVDRAIKKYDRQQPTLYPPTLPYRQP